jgi:glycosyltransferase involved in cell wall biosynthesis
MSAKGGAGFSPPFGQAEGLPHRSKFAALSVFFPAYNDAPSLPGLIAKTFAVLERHVTDYEVIVVNDGSWDNTAEVLEKLERQYAPRMTVVTHERNRGYGGALRSGFETAKKEYVFYTDGDGQYDVGELPLLLERAGSGAGLVNGYKLERHDPRHRIWIGSAYNFCARLLFRIRIPDIDCDFRLIRRALLDRVQLTATGGAICVELVRKLELSGCPVEEVGVHHYARAYGRSQFFRVRSLAETFRQLAGLWLRLVVLGGRSGRLVKAAAREEDGARRS